MKVFLMNRKHLCNYQPTVTKRKSKLPEVNNCGLIFLHPSGHPEGFIASTVSRTAGLVIETKSPLNSSLYSGINLKELTASLGMANKKLHQINYL